MAGDCMRPDWARPRNFPFLARYQDRTVRPSGVPVSERESDVCVEDEAGVTHPRKILVEHASGLSRVLFERHLVGGKSRQEPQTRADPKIWRERERSG